MIIIEDISPLSIKESKSNDIHFEALHLTDKIHNNRRQLKPLTDIVKSKTKSKIVADKNLSNSCNSPYKNTNGTTCGLKEIMIGRCNEYQYVRPGLFLTNQS